MSEGQLAVERWYAGRLDTMTFEDWLDGRMSAITLVMGEKRTAERDLALALFREAWLDGRVAGVQALGKIFDASAS